VLLYGKGVLYVAEKKHRTAQNAGKTGWKN